LPGLAGPSPWSASSNWPATAAAAITAAAANATAHHLRRAAPVIDLPVPPRGEPVVGRAAVGQVRVVQVADVATRVSAAVIGALTVRGVVPPRGPPPSVSFRDRSNSAVALKASGSQDRRLGGYRTGYPAQPSPGTADALGTRARAAPDHAGRASSAREGPSRPARRQHPRQEREYLQGQRRSPQPARAREPASRKATPFAGPATTP
jgi:hypothetical protein